MNSLLILLYVVVWRVCTILRVIAPVSAVRAWCEYQLEGMTILRDAYSSLAKAAGMQNEAFEYLKDIARHLGYEICNPWERGWNDGWTECLNQRVAGILKQACVDFFDAD